MPKKQQNLFSQSLEQLAEDWGVDIQIIRIKMELIDTIRDHCEFKGVSQRKLASLVPGLTQDRVSKIFSGQVGHMTIDKLIEILSTLDFQIAVKTNVA